MIYKIAAYSDIGIVKKTNQDSVLMKVAQTNHGRVCLCVVCDGMGGLANGELASATVIREFDKWFRKDLPAMLEMPVFPVEELRLQWDNLVLERIKKLADYASSTGTRMGTTVVAFLIVGENYYIMNIGDSRAYMITDAIYQLTKDQTYVQFEMGCRTHDLGRGTDTSTEKCTSSVYWCFRADQSGLFYRTGKSGHNISVMFRWIPTSDFPG